MNADKCKGCPFYKAYWMGTDEEPEVSCICFWTLKDPAEVKESQCKNSTRRV